MNAIEPAAVLVPAATKLPKLTPAQAESVFAIVKAKPEIDVKQGMSEIVELAIAELIKTGLVFDRGGVLVALDRDNTLHTLTPTTTRFALSRLASFVKTSLAKGHIITEPVDTPKYIGETICALTKWPGMPIVEAITDHPIVTTEGRSLGAGYDAETRIFGRFDETAFHIPAHPTKEDAADALLKLKRLLQTFDFEHEGDEAAALAAMLTAVCRPVLKTALMVLIDATTSGSGKGYLGGILARLAHDAEPAAKQMKADDAEMDKLIISILMAARPVCFFDELGMAEIDLPSLRSFASAAVYGGRILGLNKDVEFSTRTFVEATGNNVGPTADMARRMLHLRLNPLCENPSARQFHYDCGDPAIHSAEQDVIENRHTFIECVLTIQKAFILEQQGGLIPDPKEPIGGFKEWEQMCRLPILWLTGIDPCKRMLATMKSNPHKNELLTIISAWHEAFGDKVMRTTDALKDDAFLEVCRDTIKRKPGSDISNVTLGIWIKKHIGQVVDGKYFEADASINGTQYWRVKKVG